MTTDEPNITINGCTLTQGEAMTVRVAIQNFAMSLQADGLGEDELGRGICAGYLANINHLNVLMRADHAAD